MAQLIHSKYGKLPYVIENSTAYFPEEVITQCLGFKNTHFKKKIHEIIKPYKNSYYFEDLDKPRKKVKGISYEGIIVLVPNITTCSPEEKGEILSWLHTAVPGCSSEPTNVQEPIKEEPVEPFYEANGIKSLDDYENSNKQVKICKDFLEAIEVDVQRLKEEVQHKQQLKEAVSYILRDATDATEQYLSIRSWQLKNQWKLKDYDNIFRENVHLKVDNGEKVLRGRENYHYNHFRSILTIKDVLSPTDISNFLREEGISQGYTCQELNKLIIKWNYQTVTLDEAQGVARYTVNPLLGSDYAYVVALDGKSYKDNRDHPTLCWTRKGLALIIGSLLFEERKGEGNLALAI